MDACRCFEGEAFAVCFLGLNSCGLSFRGRVPSGPYSGTKKAPFCFSEFVAVGTAGVAVLEGGIALLPLLLLRLLGAIVAS